MKLRLEATPDELREKHTELLRALCDELLGIAPEITEVLEKALPSKEQKLKYPVLRSLQKKTSAEYDRTLKKMVKAIGKVLDQGPGVVKALYIGPRGGKWADPKHTIPWDAQKHGKQVGLAFMPPAEKKAVVKPNTDPPGKYRYGVPFRPIGFATVPKGYEKEEHPKFKHGVVVYDKPLSSEEMAAFELIPILDRKQLVDRIGAVFDGLRDYSEEYLELADEDPRGFSQIVRQRFEQIGGGHVDDIAVVERAVLDAMRKDAGKEVTEVKVEGHPLIFGEACKETYRVVKENSDGTVQISRHKDGTFGPTMPKESLKHFQNDLAGKVVLPKSGRSDINAVISGKAEFLGKGDDGLAFKVGDKVLKVSTTVPYQPDNPGHRSPQQAIEMLRGQHSITMEMIDAGIPGLQASEFVVHGDKGFQVKDWVKIPSKWTREQLDQIQDTIIAMHRKGYALCDAVQVGLDRGGNPVLFDAGKAGKMDDNQDQTSIYGDITGDMDNLVRLYRDSGEYFVRRDVDEARQHWQRLEGKLPKLIAKNDPKKLVFAVHLLETAVQRWKKQAEVSLSGKELVIELAVIDFQAGDLLFDINRALKKMGKAEYRLNIFESDFGKSLHAVSLFQGAGAGEKALAPEAYNANMVVATFEEHNQLDPMGEAVAKSLEAALITDGWRLYADDENDDPELLRKAQTHKYVRRVPYTGKDGKRRYRYYYRESAAARGAKEEAIKQAVQSKAPTADLFASKEPITEPMVNDFTKPIVDKDARAYDRVKTVLQGKGYLETDFGEGGPFYGWSVNQLIDFARAKED